MSYNASFVSALKEALNGLKTIHQVGEEWVSYVGDIPTGGVPYCGQEVNRSTYSALWAYAQAKGLVKSESEWQSLYASQGGNVAYYSSGNGSSTFRMPRLVGYVRGASSQAESGGYVKEGIPNIVGYAVTAHSPDSCFFNVTDATGAFYATGLVPNIGTSVITGGRAGEKGLGFDASLSSDVYGNSAHVTPETSCILFGVYAFGEVANVDALDAATLASAVARVESNMINKASPHIVEYWRNGTEWYKKYSNGIVEQGGELTGGQSSLTFLVEFADVFYNVQAFATSNSYAVTEHSHIDWTTKTTTGVTVRVAQYGSAAHVSGDYNHVWEAKGYYKQ